MYIDDDTYSSNLELRLHAGYVDLAGWELGAESTCLHTWFKTQAPGF